jgi:putative sigma-54 modulation protein
MDLEFTFRHIESTDAIKAWANKRFKKVEKHLSDATLAHLVLSVDKFRHRAEMTVHSHGEILHASDETDDMYQAMDGVMAKIEHAAQSRKERQLAGRHGT